MTASLLPDRRGLLFTFALWLVIGGVLLAMGRVPICTCGSVKLWWGTVQSAENSQHIADWYSFSHVIHGLLFYFFAHLLLVRLPADGRSRARGQLGWLRSMQRNALPIAVAFEGLWELLENSPLIIERYRAVTVSYGYEGDSVINSLSDIGFMALGFWIASRLPWKASLALAIVFELFTLFMIRDNLTLNVLMLVWPLEAVRQWQAGG